MPAPRIRIERTVRLIYVVDVNDETYPGMSPQEARELEYADALADKLMQFAEEMTVVDFSKPLDWGTPGTTGEFSEKIVICDEEQPA